jgi:hypothetical protein
MFGITMLDKKVPNFWTWTRADRRGAASCVTVDMSFPSDRQPPAGLLGTGA